LSPLLISTGSPKNIPFIVVQHHFIILCTFFLLKKVIFGKSALKRQCHKIFDLWFFHHSTPPRALTHRLKPFRIWLRIRRENCFSGVNDTAEMVSAVSMTLLKFGKLNFWCWNPYDILNFTIMVVSAVSMTPRKQLWGSGLKYQQCQWHRWNGFKGVIDSNNVDFLGKYEAICKTVLACESGP
jgi:hypothetical protein